MLEAPPRPCRTASSRLAIYACCLSHCQQVATEHRTRQAARQSSPPDTASSFEQSNAAALLGDIRDREGETVDVAADDEQQVESRDDGRSAKTDAFGARGRRQE